MDTLVWRIRVKVVAWIDIVSSCLFLFEIILMPVMITAFAIVTNDPETVEDFDMEGRSDEEPEKANSMDLKYVLITWAVATVLAVVVGFQLWAAIKLLGAAKLGVEPAAALRKARIWQCVTIVIFLLSIIADIIFTIFIMFFSFTMSVIICRSIAFFVVYKFMKEIESITTMQSVELNNFPECAIIK